MRSMTSNFIAVILYIPNNTFTVTLKYKYFSLLSRLTRVECDNFQCMVILVGSDVLDYFWFFIKHHQNKVVLLP